jgi:hypothetical protein
MANLGGSPSSASGPKNSKQIGHLNLPPNGCSQKPNWPTEDQKAIYDDERLYSVALEQ